MDESKGLQDQSCLKRREKGLFAEVGAFKQNGFQNPFLRYRIGSKGNLGFERRGD